MTASWRRLRLALLVLLVALAASTWVALLGGPDLLGEGRSVAFGVLLLAWFSTELRGPDSTGSRRRALWVGVAAAVVLSAASVGSLLA